MKIILILSANPKDTPRLRINEEMREITEGLRRARQRENFVIETGQAVRYRDILRAILDFEPNIVHFGYQLKAGQKRREEKGRKWGHSSR